jgi:hypothetical protein
MIGLEASKLRVESSFEETVRYRDDRIFEVSPNSKSLF